MQVRNGNYPPIKEGDLSTITCNHLERLLKAAGATVVWTRDEQKPVTPLRPHDLYGEALTMYKKQLKKDKRLRYVNNRTLTRVKLWSNLLFYRVFEIAARAEKIKGIPTRLHPLYSL